MKLATPYKCDGCEELKGEANHWWLVFKGSERFAVYMWDTTLDAVTPDVSGAAHLCSESCVAKALSKWMGN